MLVYFDAAYIAKCYLNEPNANLVRQFAYGSDGLACCEIGRVEFCSVIQRHLRENNISAKEAHEILKDFRMLPISSFLRALDAIHLACAKENGFQEIYTNDRHMLDGAQYFHLKGVNLIP